MPRVRGLVEREDLISAGVIGCQVAVERYDPTLGAFSSYAVPVIRGAMLDEIRRLEHHQQRRRIGVGQVDPAPPIASEVCDRLTVEEMLSILPDFDARLVRDRYLASFTVEEIAEREGITPENVERLLNASKRRIRASFGEIAI